MRVSKSSKHRGRRQLHFIGPSATAGHCRVERLEARTLFSTGYDLKVVTAFGQPLPNPADGVFTGDFEPGGVNNKGQIVFTSDQGKPDAAHDQGQAVFLTRNDGGKPFRTLNLSNTPAPGGGTFGGFGSLSPDGINNIGDAVYAFTLSGDNPHLYKAGVYRFTASTGKLTAVVTPGVTKASDGTTLLGTSFNPSINDAGDVAFVGVVDTPDGAFPDTGRGEGLFLAKKNGVVRKLVVPGDAAPGGTTFDSVQLTSLNDKGDVAFSGHLAADPRLGDDGTGLGPVPSVFLRHSDGSIESLARQGTPIPSSAGGGWYDVAFGAVVNNRGDVAYTAPISPTKPTGDPATDDPSKDADGVFLYSHGTTVAVARPGQLMPGGAHLVSTSFQSKTVYLSNRGEVAFGALLDDGTQGEFVWANGVISLVARTGTKLPGGAVVSGFDLFGGGLPSTFVANNDKGQVSFAVVLKGGGQALVLASPKGQPNVAPVVAQPPSVFAPGSLVRGKTIAQWEAAWWTQVLQTKVHKADGKTILNPNFDETGDQTTAQGDTGKVFFLFGSFGSGQLKRTATVPAGEPILVSVLANEFSNADTAGPDGMFPGHFTAAELAAQSRQSADAALHAGGELHLTVDGQPVADVAAHRETSPVFSYTLPATDNVLQNFGIAGEGLVSPAVADGYWVMLQPLSKGRHVVTYGGTLPADNPLGAFTLDLTYVLKVV